MHATIALTYSTLWLKRLHWLHGYVPSRRYAFPIAAINKSINKKPSIALN